MKFHEFQNANIKRAREAFPKQCLTPECLSLAICGEAGELANIVKKVQRGDFSVEDARDDILSEIADVVTYCDLLNSVLKAQTDFFLEKKWNEVSKRRGWKNLSEATARICSRCECRVDSDGCGCDPPDA